MDDQSTCLKGPSLTQLLAESLDSLRRLGRRSMLALLGIVVGSASIIALLNIGSNAADESIRALKSLGTETLVVNFPQSQQNKRQLPSTIDTNVIKNSVKNLAYIAPITLQSSRVSFNGKATDANIVGSTSDLAQAFGLHLRQGRFLSDFDHRETFVVVGARVARDLGTAGSFLQVGDRLQIENYLFQVIGIAESFPANALIPVAVDESVILPIEGMRRLRPSLEIGSLIGKVTPAADLPTVATNLRNYLIKLFNGREVIVQIPQNLLDGIKHQADTFSYLLAGLGGISLLVGGVGVMNVMLMNVSERRKEIGVRMALGARPRDIRTLFLLEATSLSVAGSLLGALLGLIIAYVFTYVSGWRFSLAPESLFLGCGSSLLIGLFFGLYPAMSAARLQPAQALRDV